METETSVLSPSAIVRYPSLSRHWREVFGGEVRKITLDPGFSCPNRTVDGKGGCVFCDPASFSPASGDSRSIAEQLRVGIESGLARGRTRFAAYFQPRTNTFAPPEKLAEAWDAAAARSEIVALCVGTRPDCVGEEVLELLAGYRSRFREIWLELGLQSANDATLASLGRGHDSACFADAARRAGRRGLLVCAHVILGLPGETAESEAATSAFLSALGVPGVKLHQLAVVRGTPLAERYARGEFACLTGEEYARRAAAFVKALPAGTVLHRLVGDSLGGSEIAPCFDKNLVLTGIRKKLQE